jgi:hypothetical protein
MMCERGGWKSWCCLDPIRILYRQFYGGIKIIYTYMVDSTSAASSANERNPSCARGYQVNLFPWVLVSPYDNAWAVAIQQKQRVFMMLVSE